MRQFMTFKLTVAALLFCASMSFAQDKAVQTAILQKLSDIESRLTNIESRLTDMDKRLTTLEIKFDERFNAVNIRIDAVNQRIDDKFNLIVGLLAIIAAFLALPYAPRLLERFKIKNDTRKLQGELDQLKTEMAQLTRLVQKPTP